MPWLAQQLFMCVPGGKPKRWPICLAKKVLCLEAEIDSLKEKANENHIAREKVGVCDPRCGPTFLSLVNNLERISDHAHNIVNVVTLGY